MRQRSDMELRLDNLIGRVNRMKSDKTESRDFIRILCFRQSAEFMCRCLLCFSVMCCYPCLASDLSHDEYAAIDSLIENLKILQRKAEAGQEIAPSSVLQVISNTLANLGVKKCHSDLQAIMAAFAASFNPPLDIRSYLPGSEEAPLLGVRPPSG